MPDIPDSPDPRDLGQHPDVPRAQTPTEAWTALKEGNERFVSGQLSHPDQVPSRRAELVSAQHPNATVFGCSDSRVPAEIVFDQGLGDLFVIRTAGQVIDTAVLGSLEFGVEVLKTPLIVVLGHAHCGAVKATIDAMATGAVPGGFLRDIVEKVMPSLVRSGFDLDRDPGHVLVHHVQETVQLMVERSAVIRTAIDEGRCAVMGLVYDLEHGQVSPVEVKGDVGDADAVHAAETAHDWPSPEPA